MKKLLILLAACSATATTGFAQVPAPAMQTAPATASPQKTPDQLIDRRAQYLAKELGPKGIRSNLIAAGPVKTMAAKSIPGFQKFEDVWSDRAPLGWDVTDSSAVAKAVVALLSDWFPATTGSMIHVDGGFHAMGV